MDLVIPTKNNKEYLEQAILSMIKTNNNTLINSIIVDNSDNDETVKMLRELAIKYNIEIEELYE